MQNVIQPTYDLCYDLDFKIQKGTTQFYKNYISTN